MANNPYVNKVELADGTTLVDLTNDTVTAGDMLTGTTAHDAAGRSVTGTLSPVVKNDSEQWINGNTSSTKLGVACDTQYYDAFISADSEGGNVQVRKGNGVLAEFDSAGLMSNGTGCARIFTKYPNGTDKTFQFKQDGDFVDGNGVSLDTTAGSVAIICNGNTHVALSKGEYVYIKNHNTLSEGLYSVTAAVAQNGTLSTSNVSEITRGIGCQVTVLNNAVGKIKRAGRGGTNSSTGVFSFTMENSTSAFVIINSNVIGVYVTAGGALYNSTLPSGYTIERSGTTVTITKTTSVSTVGTVAYLVIGV